MPTNTRTTTTFSSGIPTCPDLSIPSQHTQPCRKDAGVDAGVDAGPQRACEATYPVLCHVVIVGHRQLEPPRETVGV